MAIYMMRDIPTYNISDYQSLYAADNSFYWFASPSFWLDGKSALIGGYQYWTPKYTFSSPYSWITSAGTANTALRWFYTKPDWTKVFCTDGGYNIYEYDITWWDVTTIANSSSKSKSLSTTTYWMWFSQDGKNLYTCDKTYIYQWSLSTAWDISTISSSYVNSITNLGNYIYDIALDMTWTKLYITVYQWINQYSLWTAWDISTINTTATDTLTPSRWSGSITQIWGITFSTDYKYVAFTWRYGNSNSWYLSTYKIPD